MLATDPTDVPGAVTSSFTGLSATSVGEIVAAAVVAWGIKAAFVAWRTASKATNKIGG